MTQKLKREEARCAAFRFKELLPDEQRKHAMTSEFDDYGSYGYIDIATDDGFFEIGFAPVLYRLKIEFDDKKPDGNRASVTDYAIYKCAWDSKRDK